MPALTGRRKGARSLEIDPDIRVVNESHHLKLPRRRYVAPSRYPTPVGAEPQTLLIPDRCSPAARSLQGRHLLEMMVAVPCVFVEETLERDTPPLRMLGPS